MRNGWKRAGSVPCKAGHFPAAPACTGQARYGRINGVSENHPQQMPLQVKYESFEAVYASQALVQANPEEIVLDFSSGIVADPQHGHVMPIHTRVAMSRPAVERLMGALQQALQARPPTGDGVPQSQPGASVPPWSQG